MLRLLLFRFWPVFLPILAYLLWLAVQRSKVAKAGEKKPSFFDGPWFWTVMASLLTAGVCFLFFGSTADPVKGEYVPPQVIDGVIVPGHVRQ